MNAREISSSYCIRTVRWFEPDQGSCQSRTWAVPPPDTFKIRGFCHVISTDGWELRLPYKYQPVRRRIHVGPGSGLPVAHLNICLDQEQGLKFDGQTLGFMHHPRANSYLQDKSSRAEFGTFGFLSDSKSRECAMHRYPPH